MIKRKVNLRVKKAHKNVVECLWRGIEVKVLEKKK
jgi:hypothetical protein